MSTSSNYSISVLQKMSSKIIMILITGELGTKRFCAANDHGTYCQYVKQPTGDREHRSCVYTCSSENCNGAPGSIGLTSATIYLAIISIAINNYLASSTSTRNII